MLGLHSLDGPPERVPISTGVCGDQCVAALISVAVVCGDQYNAVLISGDVWTVGTIALHRHDDDRESKGQRAQSVCRSARVCVAIHVSPR